MLRSFLSGLRRAQRLLLVAIVIGGGLFGQVAVSEAGTCNCLCQGPGGATAPSAASCSTDLDCTYTACRNACAAQGAGFSPGTNADGRRIYSCTGGVNLDDGLTQEEQERLDQALDRQRTETPTTAPSGRGRTRAGTTAPAPEGTPRGTCSFSCGSDTVSARPAQVIVACTSNSDCAQACTNRCPVPGPAERDPQGRPSNGLSQNADGLQCVANPEPRCVFPAGTDAPAGADTAPSGAGGTEGGLRFTLPSCTENGNCSLTDIINTGIRAANFLLALSGLVFLATVLWAGAQLIFFAQDAKSIGKAQAMLTSASIAMIIIMVAGVAVRFVSSSLQVTPSLLEAPGRSANSPRSSNTAPATNTGGANTPGQTR